MENYLQKLNKDMELRGFQESTKKYYYSNVTKFLNYWDKSPEDATESDIAEYLHGLIKAKNLSPTTINKYNTAIRFFFEVTLNKTLNLRAIPMIRTGSKLPVLLSREELWRLFDVCEIKYKAIFMTFYGSGIRLAELAHLKISDIDSKNMQIFIRQGKRKKDRYALLSQSNLQILREYWKACRPSEWLFESLPGKCYTSRAIQCMLDRNLKKAGISKNATVHTLRHCFATHLMEDGVDAFVIKQLMGHANIKSTAIYVHLTNLNTLKAASPLDKMEGLTNA